MIATPVLSFGAILTGARQYNASDIHLVAGLPPAMRVGGEILIASNWDPVAPEDINRMADAFLSDELRTRLERERELCVSHHHPECGRIRISLYHRVGSIEMAIRMCNFEVKTAEELRLPPVLEDLARRASGLILITGPTGMGKTTTMNYLLDLINATRRCRIITIEDPVEFEHHHRKSIITQIEVGTDTNSFAGCLRHVLRLDPDVIAIGELRDMETIATALTAAETGHLVVATLHTPSAAGTAERIIGSFEGSAQAQVSYQLSSTLLAVIAQRLVPSVDKEKQILATELMLATEAIRHQIREGAFHHLLNTIAGNRALGMHTMEYSLGKLYQEGLISLDQAMANANHPRMLKEQLRT